ncbi:MAG TPA: carboxylating nicotinate-nucleotide diphosphorylase [Burkholderiales bacterium]|nr:carboxylating nicotinate-nucleotide diphosphorylase [Burkholderiales bacterium]
MDLASAIERDVAAALAEDVGSGDVSARLLPEGRSARATVTCRQQAVLCGQGWFEACFRRLDARAAVSWLAAEGARIAPGARVCEVRGQARALLTAERTALNFLQLLSAVATETRRYVEAVAGTRARIVDTRKTLPGLRAAQKYAVRVGGGANHRMGLYDAVLIKENHIAAAGGIRAAIAAARRAAPPGMWMQVEVETLEQLREALEAGATLILLDNMDLETMREAVRIAGERAELEASGGITLANVRAVAETGVHRISIGALTKDVKAVDFSMRFEKGGSNG